MRLSEIYISMVSLLNLCSTHVETQSPLFNCKDYLHEPYGVTAHIALNNEKYGDYQCKDSLLVLAKDAGMTYVRFELDPRCENVWSETTIAVKTFGLKSFVVLTKWDYDKNLKPWDDYQRYTKYLKSAVEGHGKSISVWEIMNEVDLILDDKRKGGAENTIATRGYISILPKTISYLREQCPQSKISMGSICNWESSFVRTLFNERHFDSTDIFNFHLYSTPENLFKGFQNMKAKMDKSNCYPQLWLTECGMPTNIDLSKNITTEELEDEQARRVARIHFLSFAYGAEKVFWYNLRSLENDPYNKESHFGLLHRDLSPKPAYHAYKVMTEMCPSGSLRPKLTIKGYVYICYWEKPDGKRVWAIWSTKKQAISTLKIKRALSYFDYMGNKQKKPKSLDTGIVYIVGDSNTHVEF